MCVWGGGYIYIRFLTFLLSSFSSICVYFILFDLFVSFLYNFILSLLLFVLDAFCILKNERESMDSGKWRCGEDREKLGRHNQNG